MIFIEDFIFNSFIVSDDQDPSFSRFARAGARGHKIGEFLSGQNSRRKEHLRSHRLWSGPGNDKFIINLFFSSNLKKLGPKIWKKNNFLGIF